MAFDFSSLLCFIVDIALYFDDCSFFIPTDVSLIVTLTKIVNGSPVGKNSKFKITTSVNTEPDNAPQPQDLQIDVYDALVNTPEKFEEVCEVLR